MSIEIKNKMELKKQMICVMRYEKIPYELSRLICDYFIIKTTRVYVYGFSDFHSYNIDNSIDFIVSRRFL